MKKIILGLAFLSFITFKNDASAQRQNPIIKIGQDAPEIALPNPDGDTLKLSKINKKSYVIVDFWASWCGPCRRANPTLVAMMKDLEGVKLTDAKRGIKVLSVSLDRNKEAWVAGIEKDDLYWDGHISDLNHWNSIAAEEWGVRAIPQVFLVDPNGKIIGNYFNIHQLKVDIDQLIEEKSKKKK